MHRVPVVPNFRLNLAAFFISLLLGSFQAKGSNSSTSDEPKKNSSIFEAVEGHLYSGWESHYFTEGRDLLDGDSLIVNSTDLTWTFLTGEIWYAFSPDQSYDELQLSLVASHSVNDLEFYFGYTHLQFPSDDLYDNEISGGIVLSSLPAGVEVAIGAYHSFDADGYFVELSAEKTFTFTDSLELIGSGVFGINQGYVADGHDGANHLGLRLELNYMISSAVSLISHVTYSWAIDRDQDLSGDETLVDFFNGGFGVQWSF